MDVLAICQYEEDSIKNRGARVFTALYIYFSDAQGQITLELVVVSGLHLNSIKLSCMSLLPARMSMIDSKMKELEGSQDFSHYKYMGIFYDAQGQLTPQSLVRSSRISLPASMKKIRSKMKALGCSQHSPHYSYPLPWTPEFRSNLAQNQMKPFSHPNDASDKISLLLAHWLRRYSSLKIFTHRHTDDSATGIL